MSDGKLKANTDELWAFFSDMNYSVSLLDEEIEGYEKKLQSLHQRLENKIIEINSKIEQLNAEIAALRSKDKESSSDNSAQIAALQTRIGQYEEKIIRLKKYVRLVPENVEMIKKSQKSYQSAFSEGKKIVNRYLKMVEITIAQKEFTNYQESTVAGQYHVMQYRGSTFYCNDDIFDIDSVDEKGRTNLQRMEAGIAPLGKDGKAIELHHTMQSENFGNIVELPSSVHRKNHKALHINTHDIPSGINRSNFDVLRSAYWKRRAEFIKRGVLE